MIRHTVQFSSLRFYESDTPTQFEPYAAICSITWETPTIIWITGLHGTLTRKMLRQLVQFFFEHNIATVKAHRADSRALPFVTYRTEYHVEIDVSKIPLKYGNIS
jgi:hypothetical protein